MDLTFLTVSFLMAGVVFSFTTDAAGSVVAVDTTDSLTGSDTVALASPLIFWMVFSRLLVFSGSLSCCEEFSDSGDTVS